jgi:hypothetical protein
MNAASARYLSTLRMFTPSSISSLSSAGQSSGLPALWYENDVLWAIPATGQSYPVAYTSLEAFVYIPANFSSAGIVNRVRYQPPFTSADAPAWCDSSLIHGQQQFFTVMACTPSAMPFARQILTGLGIQVPATLGPVYPGLTSTFVAPSTNGSRTLHLKYVLVVPNTANPSNAAFPSTDLN